MTEPMKEDRERAEKVANKIDDAILKTSPGDRWNMILDIIEAEFAAVRAERDEALVAAAREAIREWENVIAGVKANDPDVVIIDGAYHDALAALVEVRG